MKQETKPSIHRKPMKAIFSSLLLTASVLAMPLLAHADQMKTMKHCGKCCKQGGDCCDKCKDDKCASCCDKK